MNSRWFGLILVFVLSAVVACEAQTYLGFDRNDYPGDANLSALRQTFSFAGFWLNNPPGAASNSWAGKRKAVEAAGFGFLVLFNGRLYAELRSVDRAAELGKSDAKAAAKSARLEGFARGTVIFLDEEEGGRMLPEQKAYLYAWVDEILADGFRAGIYCSGIAARERHGARVVTANDIRENSDGRKIAYFVTNDACPPSQGCSFRSEPPNPSKSGIAFAEVWQFAQSPKRPSIAGRCSGYNPDGACYPPGVDPELHVHIDVDTATSPDPSHAR